MSESKITRVGLAFYPEDVNALSDRANVLKKNRVKTRKGGILRALLYHATREEMMSYHLQLVTAYARKKGPREVELISNRPTIDLPSDQLKKLDGVVSDLARLGVIATRSLVMRALLRASPADAAIVPIVEKFQKECPPRLSRWAAHNAKLRHG